MVKSIWPSMLATTFFLGFVSCASASNGTVEGIEMKESSSIHRAIASVITADNPDRVKHAAALEQRISNMSLGERQAITPSEIDELALLLSDKNKTVQYYAAVSLGNIGADAVRAVPTLRKAINRIETEEEKEFIKPAVTGAYYMYVAIQKITGEQPPAGILK